MAIDHGKIGDLLGWWARGSRILLDFREGGAAYTADGLDQFRTETEALLDLDDDHRWLLKFALDFITEREIEVSSAIRGWVDILDLAARQIIGPEIASSAGSLGKILGDLYTVMRTDSKTVQENRITVGSVTAHGDNVGDGTLFIYDEDPQLKDDNERINSQDILAYCRADAVTGGRTAGHELFQLASSLRGNGPRVPVKWNEAYGQNRVTNHSFEDWTAATNPDSWTVEDGTGGTHIEEETSTVKFGSSSLQFNGDGAQGTIGVKQAETAMAGYSATQRLVPNGVYRCNVWINTDGSVSGRTITVEFRGTSYTAGSSEKVEITSSFPTSWTRYGFWVVIPKDIPSDFALHLEVSGTLGASENVYFDGVTFGKATPWNDVGVQVFIDHGGTDYVAAEGERPDQFDVSITNDYASEIQTQLTRLTNTRKPRTAIYPDVGQALPSASSESTEYDDSKAA